MSFADGLEIEDFGGFLRPKAGDIIHFHILSEKPKKMIVHWINNKKSDCLLKNCEHCQRGDKPKQRWDISVWDRKEQSVKKFDFGASIARQIKNISEMLTESGQSIFDVDLKIKTEGSGIDTEYTVMNVPKGAAIPLEILEQFRVPF